MTGNSMAGIEHARHFTLTTLHPTVGYVPRRYQHAAKLVSARGYDHSRRRVGKIVLGMLLVLTICDIRARDADGSSREINGPLVNHLLEPA